MIVCDDSDARRQTGAWSNVVKCIPGPELSHEGLSERGQGRRIRPIRPRAWINCETKLTRPPEENGRPVSSSHGDFKPLGFRGLSLSIIRHKIEATIVLTNLVAGVLVHVNRLADLGQILRVTLVLARPEKTDLAPSGRLHPGQPKAAVN